MTAALGVSVIPEALPVVTTFCLTRGAALLARHKVVVKRLSAIQDLGSMQVLCTDKTGTLTENKLAVVATMGSEKELLLYATLGSGLSSRALSLRKDSMRHYIMPCQLLTDRILIATLA